MLRRILHKILTALWTLICEVYLFGIPNAVIDQTVIQAAIQRTTGYKEQDRNMLKIKKISENATIPEWRGVENAGLDIYSAEDATLLPGEIQIIKTGIATEFDNRYVALLRDRSGLATKGIHVLAGVIDACYRGEWGVVLVNLGKDLYKINEGDRIAQAVFVMRQHLPIEEVHFLSDTTRGKGGFGSTGK